MHTLVPIGEIKERAAAIGVNLKTLARDAGVSHSNVYRAAKGTSDPRSSTLVRLTEALVARERRLLEKLQDSAA